MLVNRPRTAWELMNLEKVTNVELRLRELRTAFLERFAPMVLSAAEIAEIEAATDDVAAFGGEIRGRATPFIIAGLSGVFWAVNDAFAHFDDAVGLRWRYMDYSDRDKALEFSERMINASGLV